MDKRGHHSPQIAQQRVLHPSTRLHDQSVTKPSEAWRPRPEHLALAQAATCSEIHFESAPCSHPGPDRVYSLGRSRNYLVVV